MHTSAGTTESDPTRVLTVRHPWGGLIAAGLKDTENRTWPTRHRGPVLIHSSAGRIGTPILPIDPARVPEHLQAPGRILAHATLADCHQAAPGCCASPWAEPFDGIWHWALTQVRALPRPVPAKGRLGLWRPGPGLLAEVGEQLAQANPPPARRIQRRRSAGWRMPPEAVYVGRPTRFGNPYAVAEHGRAAAVALYRNHLAQRPDLIEAARTQLRGKPLACWCPTDGPCHADVLIEIANEGGSDG